MAEATQLQEPVQQNQPQSQPQASQEARTVAEGVPTPLLIAAMIKASKHVSDLIFSPGRAPQVESSGQLVQLGEMLGIKSLTAEDTARIAARPDRLEQNGH